jgi:5'-methylthioadenosine phosphorylase
MRTAIIGGSGFDKIPDFRAASKIIETRYGQVEVFMGEGEAEDLLFLPRHGSTHQTPPHRINYRANMLALKQLGVRRALALFTVGSLDEAHPPGSISVLDQFIDFSYGREATFFDGGGSGLVHTEVTDPFCPALRGRLLEAASERGVEVLPSGTYVCTNGPRFETAAEISMFAQLGGHVVGMTGVPEIPLAREAGIHYAAMAISVNWGAGLKGKVKVETGNLANMHAVLIPLCMEVLRTPEPAPCVCETSLLVLHPPSV